MKMVPMLAGLIAGLGLTAVGWAQEKTAEVQRGPIKVVYELSGTVKSDQTASLEFDNEQLTELKVDTVVDHGQVVTAGQVLLSLQREELEEKAQQLRQAHRLAELTFREKELAAEQAEQLNELTRIAKQRAVEQAKADFEYWEKVTWPQRLEDVEDNHRRSQEFLEDAEMEFNQLKQMYEEDELVEESEELVLRREKRNLDRARKSFERAVERYERTKEVELPRQEQAYREGHQRNMMQLEKDLETVEDGFEKQQIEMEKAEIEFQKAVENMEKLEKELANLKMKAPFDGVVYHGSWPESGKTVEIEADGKVAAKTTLLTLASLEDRYLEVALTEEQLAKVAAGTVGYAVPTAFPKDVMSVRVRSVEAVPSSNKTFPCDLTLQHAPAGLLPGMTATVKLQAYENESALLVPTTAVHTDNGSEHYVYVVSKSDEESDAAPEKVMVKTGVSANGKTEILSGLKEGTSVLLGQPGN